MRKLKCYAVLMSLSWTAVCFGTYSPEDLKESIRSRLASLQNIIVEYKANTTYTPPQEDVERAEKLNETRKSKGTVVVILSGSDKRDTSFSFLRGKAKYVNKFVETNYAGGLTGRPKLEVQAFPGSRAELLKKDALGYRGIITERIRLPDSEVEIGLGMRGWGQNGWLVDDLLKEMSVTVLDGNTASLEYVDPKGVKHRWLVDQELGCALKHYERILTKINNKLNHVMTMEDFKKVDGLMLPHKMTLRALNNPGEQPLILKEVAIEVIEYKLNDPQNIQERYHIKWPEGTIVHDRILETTYISDGTGLQPQGYINRKTLDPESTLLKPIIGGNVTSIKKSTHKELFIPKVQIALKKNQPFILDLAHAKLLSIPINNELYSKKIHRHLIKSGRGDLAWDGSLVTLRKAKALTVSQESHRPLKCTPGRWCNWDRLPDKVDLPYSVLVVTNEDIDYLITIRKIESDGIRIIYKKLNPDEVKSYLPARKKM